MKPLPKSLESLYPFERNYFETTAGRMHFVDTKTGTRGTVVLLHGNPSWSFLWRDLIKALSAEGFRCIAPDHIGMGLSDKPQRYLKLADRIAHVEALLVHLGIEKFSLCVHDWGGAVGCGVAGRYPDKVEKLVITNTAAFRSQNIPRRIALCKLAGIGPFLVKYFNAFAFPATFMAVSKKLSAPVKSGFLFPYASPQERTAVANFVRDIPLDDLHPTYPTLCAVESGLKNLGNKPMLIAWGGRDFCFDDSFYDEWVKRFPKARTLYCADAGHYLLEDAGDEIIPAVCRFLS